MLSLVDSSKIPSSTSGMYFVYFFLNDRLCFRLLKKNCRFFKNVVPPYCLPVVSVLLSSTWRQPLTKHMLYIPYWCYFHFSSSYCVFFNRQKRSGGVKERSQIHVSLPTFCFLACVSFLFSLLTALTFPFQQLLLTEFVLNFPELYMHSVQNGKCHQTVFFFLLWFGFLLLFMTALQFC